MKIRKLAIITAMFLTVSLFAGCALKQNNPREAVREREFNSAITFARSALNANDLLSASEHLRRAALIAATLNSDSVNHYALQNLAKQTHEQIIHKLRNPETHYSVSEGAALVEAAQGLEETVDTLPHEIEMVQAALAKKEISSGKQEASSQSTSQNYFSSGHQSKRLALVIGNASYLNGGSLSNPVNDARAMATSLKSLDFDVLKYENLSQAGMRKAIDDFGARLTSYDVGLFFYAGHGLQVRGNNYLIPSDANPSTENQVEYSCVSTGRLLAMMEDAGTATNIVMLDACRNNPFERSWRRSSSGKGLAFMNAPSGSFIAYATAPGETADDGAGKNGLYTTAILEHIRTPGITIEQLFKSVRTEVEKLSNGRQVPWESTSLKGEFYFRKK